MPEEGDLAKTVADNRGVEPIRYPVTGQESPAKVKVSAINQVALVVKDLQKSVEDYWNIFGIGPWEIYSWEPPLVYDYEYHGRPAQAKARLAFTWVGGVQLELIQPIAGDSIYNDFIMERGEGLHHFNFLVDDVSKSVSLLEQGGFPCVQRARLGDNSAYVYIDMKPSRVIVGLVNSNPLSWF